MQVIITSPLFPFPHPFCPLSISASAEAASVCGPLGSALFREGPNHLGPRLLPRTGLGALWGLWPRLAGLSIINYTVDDSLWVVPESPVLITEYDTTAFGLPSALPADTDTPRRLPRKRNSRVGGFSFLEEGGANVCLRMQLFRLYCLPLEAPSLPPPSLSVSFSPADCC